MTIHTVEDGILASQYLATSTPSYPLNQQDDSATGAGCWLRGDEYGQGSVSYATAKQGDNSRILLSDPTLSTVGESALTYVLSIHDDYVTLPTPRILVLGLAVPPSQREVVTSGDPFESITNTVKEYGLLENDWDGYNGHAPNATAIADALHFLALLPRNIPSPIPGVAGDGEVGFSWKHEETYIEVSFYGDGKIIFHASHEGVVLFADEQDLNRQALPRELFDKIAML